jgi:hypothetical protein
MNELQLLRVQADLRTLRREAQLSREAHQSRDFQVVQATQAARPLARPRCLLRLLGWRLELVRAARS